MGIEESQEKNAQKPVSVMEGDGFCFDRLFLRESSSSVGQSSHIYYRSTAQGVPFQWEMQPGTPNDPPQNDEVPPPLNPPPALRSSLQKDSLEGPFICSPWSFTEKLRIKEGSGTNDGEGHFLRKNVARNSSAGQSCRMYYYHRSAKGVPYEWEIEPGKCKLNLINTSSEATNIPPPSPPPVVQSQGLPRPRVIDQPKLSNNVRFWKKSNYKKKPSHQKNKSQSFESSNLGMEFLVSFVSNSTSLTSSFSSNTSHFHLLRSWKDLKDGIWCKEILTSFAPFFPSATFFGANLHVRKW